MSFAEKSPDRRLVAAVIKADDRRQRQQIIAAGEPEYARVKITKRDTPLHRHQAEPLGAERPAEQLVVIERLGPETFGRRRLEHRRAQLPQARHRMLGRGRNLRMPFVFEILDAKQIGAGRFKQAL